MDMFLLHVDIMVVMDLLQLVICLGWPLFSLQFITRRIQNTRGEKPKVLDVKNVLESFKVLSKPRAGSMRHIVIILVICFQIGMFGMGGASYVDYLYVRRKFGSEFNGDENALVSTC